MPSFRCPGQDTRFWKPEDIFEDPCPHCGKTTDFWKDEPWRRCGSCGKNVPNPKLDLGCAKWCKYAEQCLGVSELPDKDTSLCDALIEEMKHLSGDDERRIRHALSVLDYAERILGHEEGDPLVVRAAAVLHDIGIQSAERKHGSSAGKYQEIEGSPIAREILQELAVDPACIEHICKIVANHHSAREIDTPEFRIIWDADWLVNLPEEHPNMNHDKRQAFIERVFRTKAGRTIAKEQFLEEDGMSKEEGQDE